jgi:TPP-dependent pyruvate/acetoin dehydrogenase alpha subunit
LLLQRDKLIDIGVLSDEADNEMQERAKVEVEEAVKIATEAPYPDVSEAGYPVFVEDIVDD